MTTSKNGKTSYVSIALLLTSANVIAKLLGFGKDVLISYYYGTSSMTDALFLTMAIPTMILGVFTSSADSVIIPQYNRILKTKGKYFADLNFSNIINILLIISSAVSVVILIVPEKIIPIFAPGFSANQLFFGIKFLRLFSCFGILHIIYCFFSSYLSVYQKVLIRSILSFSTNLIVIVGLLIYPDKNMLILSIAFLLGYIVHGLLPYFGARKIGYKHTWYINTRSNEFSTFLKIFAPIMGTAFLFDLNMFVDRFLSSSMGVGSISSLNYASRLTSIFDTMIIVGVGVVILPLLSNLNIDNNRKKLIDVSSKMLRILIIVLLPFSVLAMTLSKEIITLIYMRGSFDSYSVEVVSSIFYYLSPQILFISLLGIVSKFFHSIENTKVPLITAIIGVVCNILLSITLSKIMGLNGIALATSISFFVNFIILFIVYKLKVGWSKDINIIYLVKIIFVFITLYLISSNMRLFDIGLFSKLLLCSSTVLVIYYAVILLLFREDLNVIRNLLKRKNGKDLSYN